MNLWFNILSASFYIVLVTGAAIEGNGDVQEQGLYRKSDGVDILTHHNFERKIYNQNHALLVQFYNSYCGHCRAFAPRFKDLAKEIVHWARALQLAAIDCSVEENNEICRQFEVLAYPSLRFISSRNPKGSRNLGERVEPTYSTDIIKTQLVQKLQAQPRSKNGISFEINSYTSYANAVADVSNDNIYTFLVFENDNSTVGSEIILDVSDYKGITVKRVHDNSKLAQIARIQKFPAVVAIKVETTPIIPQSSEITKDSLLEAINTFLSSKDYKFPVRGNVPVDSKEDADIDHSTSQSDVVYYSDLEKTIKTSLHTEITRYNVLEGEPLQALLKYLDAIIVSFPFRGNLKEFITALRTKIATQNRWSGGEIYEIVKNLENQHAPVYITNLEYVGCKGSQPKYRGYTCGLWTLFHTLTVNAAKKPGVEGPKVLRAMHGYIKHFFGCTDCAEHFQEMAEKNRIFEVKQNNKVALWLWISHNEVNLRLAGDVTEDPEHPKTQFPSSAKCSRCRLPNGTWNLPVVLNYLDRMYSSENIRDVRRSRSAMAPPSPFSNLDIGMLSLLYMSA